MKIPLAFWLSLFFALCATAPFAYAQHSVFSGQIFDAQTQKPIDKVVVHLAGLNEMVVSDNTGHFQIQSQSVPASLSFSQANYVDFKLNISQAQSDLKIYLEPLSFELEEIVIYNKPIKEVVLELVGNSKKALNKKWLLHTYYRGFYGMANQHLRYADGLLDFYIKNKNGKTDIEVLENRNFSLKVSQADSLGAAENSLVGIFDIRQIISDSYKLDKIMEVVKSKEYDLVISTQKNSQGRSVNTMKIDPISTAKSEGLLSGFVKFDPDSNLIYEVKLGLAPDFKKYNKLRRVLVLFKIQLKELSLHNVYTVTAEGDYLLAYSQLDLDFYLKFGKKFNDTFMSSQELMVTSFEAVSTDLPAERRFRFRELFFSKSTDKTSYWKDKSTLNLPARAQATLREIEKPNSRWEKK